MGKYGFDIWNLYENFQKEQFDNSKTNRIDWEQISDWEQIIIGRGMHWFANSNIYLSNPHNY